MDQGLYQFAQTYQRNVSDPQTLRAYYGYLMECMDEQERIDSAEYRGRIEGEAKGKADIVRSALRKKKSIADIMDFTGLSEQEIDAIRNDL